MRKYIKKIYEIEYDLYFYDSEKRFCFIDRGNDIEQMKKDADSFLLEKLNANGYKVKDEWERFLVDVIITKNGEWYDGDTEGYGWINKKLNKIEWD